jgi:hypothetical protein
MEFAPSRPSRTIACAVCHSPNRPLAFDEPRYGDVFFHVGCEPKLFADRFVADVSLLTREPLRLSWLEGGFVP